MASDFFRIQRGLAINESSQIMVGTGTPSGADQNNAPIGSVFLENDAASNSLNIWFKFQSTTSTVADWAQLASKSYVDATSTSGITWKNPVAVESAAGVTTLPTGTAGNPIVVNGITVNDGDRVLFSDLTVNSNVYVYNQAAGTFSLAPDVTNPAAVGSATYVQSGPTAGYTYVYNATDWVLIDQADKNDLSYLRSFVGALTTGTAAPNYTSTNTVVQSSTLVAATSALDAKVGANVSSIAGSSIISPSNTVQQNIQSVAQAVVNDHKSGTASAVTALTALDSVQAFAVKYLVHVQDVTTPANVRAYEVFVAHNGTTTDLTMYATLAFGTVPVGLDLSASLTGGNTINLSVTSTTSVNVRWKRVSLV